MAKRISTVTHNGEVIGTRTSATRTYVAATVLTAPGGEARVLSWHQTKNAAVKYSQSNEAARIASRDGSKISLMDVECETKLSRAEAAAAEEAAAVSAEAYLAAPAAPIHVPSPEATARVVAEVEARREATEVLRETGVKLSPKKQREAEAWARRVEAANLAVGMKVSVKRIIEDSRGYVASEWWEDATIQQIRTFDAVVQFADGVRTSSGFGIRLVNAPAEEL